MSLAGKATTSILGLSGLPLAWFLIDRGLAAPWLAILLLVLYEAVIGLGAMLLSVAQQTVRRRLEQIANVADLAFGRKVSRYARHYRRYVLERNGHINTRDLAHTPSHVPELDAVYVDVGLALGSPSKRSGGLLPANLDDSGERHAIHELLDREQPAVFAVIGAPGSGKSTLLRHTARRSVLRGKRQRRRIPVLIALRDHAESLSGDPSQTLADLIRGDIGALEVKEPKDWWEVRLREGDCLVLFDGLDEVARKEDRTAVSEWIEHQIAKHPRNDFVVTSRPHGYRTAVIPRAVVLQVRPFTTEQIRTFVKGWCLATERLATNAPVAEVDRRAQEEAQDLLDQLAVAPSLQELAVNPLLLTMMVLVHRERRALPAGRADLYGQVCDVMLWRRQEAKKLEVKPNGAIRQRILATLAYEMMLEGVRDHSKPQILAIFDRQLNGIDTDIDSESLLESIVDSSGLLIEREKDLYSFSHHTFGEFLAATHIRANNLAGTLKAQVANPWWRETTVFFAANSDASPIVAACLEDDSFTALSLAFACVAGNGQIDQGLRQRIDQLHIDAFLPEADPDRRRLVARALAAHHLSRVVVLDNGTFICPDPIPLDLYWLFCKDTGTVVPDGFREIDGSDAGVSAEGMWRQEARAFVEWVNAAAIEANTGMYRIPSKDEVEALIRSGIGVLGSSTAPPVVFTSDPQTVSVPEPWSSGVELPAGHGRIRLRSQLAIDVEMSGLVGGLVSLHPEYSEWSWPDRDADMTFPDARATEFLSRESVLIRTFRILVSGMESGDANSDSVPRAGIGSTLIDLREECAMVLTANGTRHPAFLQSRSPSGACAERLCVKAKIDDGYHSSATLDRLALSLTSACDMLDATPSIRSEWIRAASERLLRSARPILARLAPPHPDALRAMRISAAVLAAEAEGLGLITIAPLFREIAYGTAQIQARIEGGLPLERLILARE
ncbi:hypothetical protein GCM10009830_18630 [Glycomyces endophyticus]|uniref:NACHT domain-containing protein n=1 Tax=Glycomyces endophyticus TaxID=480996 RepID=A0ABP4SGS2_9ACTN